VTYHIFWLDASIYGAHATRFGASEVSATPYRLFRFGGAVIAGGDVDGVGGPQQSHHDEDGNPIIDPTTLLVFAIPGLPVLVEAGAAFSAGQGLKTDAQGRAVPNTSGSVAVLRALEGASAAGDLVLAVFTSGRAAS
jgi:hypothetical protein